MSNGDNLTDAEIVRRAMSIMGGRNTDAQQSTRRQNLVHAHKANEKQAADVPCTCVVGASELDPAVHRAYCRRWRWGYLKRRREAARAAKKD